MHAAFLLFAALVSIVSAVRFDIKNATCSNLHGVRCGTYALRVVGTNDTFLGTSTFVGADVLSTGSEDAWSRYLNEEARFLAPLTTIGTNETANFKPMTFTTNKDTCNIQSISVGMIGWANTVTSEITFNDWAYTAYNVSAPTALANQLMNSTAVGVQCAECYPGFFTTLLNTPTVNIFNADDVLPIWCSALEFEPVCPYVAGI